RATRLCARRRRSGSRGFVGSRRLLRGRSASLTPGTAFGRRRCGLHLGSRGDLLHRTGLLFGLSRHLGLGLGGFLRSLLLGLLLGHVASPLFRAPPTRTLAERSLTPRAILGRRAAHTCRSRRYGDAMPARKEVLEISGREVVVSNPDKVFFPRTGHTKLDLVRYYLSVADGAVRGVAGRPMALKRFVNGAEGEFFFQKRAPTSRPDWIEVVELAFPSGRTAEEIVVRDAAQLAWVINLGCIDLNPHPVRAEDLDHPDELRVDLDPIPGVSWPQIRDVALLTKEVLADLGMRGWPQTSGSRGTHVYCRIEPRWTFPEVRRAALALAREVERRAPELASSRWWKEERHGVFLDYNQNAKDRTVASAYSVRPTPDARVSTPLSWDEVPGSEAGAFTVDTVPKRFAELGDPVEQVG